MLNLPTWLESYKKFQQFSDWVNLNQAVKDELNGTSLRDLAALGSGEHNPVYTDLLQNFKQSFLILTTQDEKTLEGHKRLFKMTKIKYSAVTFMI